MSQAASILILATFLYFGGFSLASFLFRFCGQAEKYSPFALVACVGLAGGLYSLLLEFLMTLTPGKSDGYYFSGMLLPFAAAAILSGNDARKASISATTQALSICFAPTSHELRFTRIRTAGVLCALLLLAMTFVEGIVAPMTANDPLEYASAAKYLYQTRDAAGYPMLDTDESSGYYGPWSHPMGFINLFVISFMIQGTELVSGLSKFISPAYFALSMFLIMTWCRSTRTSIAGLIGALLLATTPAYISGVMDSHIDPFRIFSFFATFLTFKLYLRTHLKLWFYLTGLLLWMTLYSHSLGILILPIIGWIILLSLHKAYRLQSAFPKLEFFQFFALLVIPILFNLPRYIANIAAFSSPIADASAVPLWQVERLEYDYYFQVTRGVYEVADRILFGVFKVLTEVTSFGFVYWIPVFFVVMSFLSQKITLRRVRQRTEGLFLNPEDYVLTWCVICYLGMVLLSVLLGMDAFIKNYRYIMTIQPIMAILAGIQIAKFLASYALRHHVGDQP